MFNRPQRISKSRAQMRERGDMLYEERLEAAERLRLAGNELFSAGDATGAMGKCVSCCLIACVL